MIFRSRHNFVILLVTIFVMGLSAACAVAESGPTQLKPLLLVPGAENIQEREVADQWQLIYETKLRYPKLALDKTRLDKLEEMGWTQCEPNEGWDHFEDITGAVPVVVHQHFEYWVKQDHIVTVMYRYFSEFRQNKRSSRPTNDTQHVYVILAPFNQQVEEILDLSCP